MPGESICRLLVSGGGYESGKVFAEARHQRRRLLQPSIIENLTQVAKTVDPRHVTPQVTPATDLLSDPLAVEHHSMIDAQRT